MSSIADLLTAFVPGSTEQQATLEVALIECQPRTTRHGDTYHVLLVGDRSGQLSVRDFRCCWESAGRPDFLRLQLRLEEYRGAASAVAETAEALPAADPLSFVAWDQERNQLLRQQLLGEIGAVGGQPWRCLLDQVFQGEQLEQFCTWTAATSMHHAWPGGLLEHSLEVLGYARALLQADPQPHNPHLLVAGALLHDLGKLDEYQAPPRLGRSTGGELAYHLAYSQLRLGMAAQAARQAGHAVPQEALWQLVHLIEQSHGAHRLDQQREALCPEARALAAADLWSARRGGSPREQQVQAALQHKSTTGDKVEG